MDGRIVLGLMAALSLVAPARAEDDDDAKDKNPFYRLDTKNLFGALEGSDVGEAGGRSVEFETTAALFKRFGRYAFVEQEVIYEITPTPRLGIELGAHAYGQSIRGQDDGNYAGVDLAAVSNEWRCVLSPRSGPWNFQATVTVTPQAARLFEGGARGLGFQLPFLLILEAQPIERRLYAALNMSYAPELDRVRGEPWQTASALGASGALSWRLTPEAMLGIEADALHEFDGLAGNRWRGSALFLGPTFHYQFSKDVDLSGAWTQQVAGWSRGATGGVNLAEFTRSQAKLRLEIDF